MKVVRHLAFKVFLTSLELQIGHLGISIYDGITMFDVNDISCMLSLVIYYPILLLLYVIVMYDGLEIVYREIMHL